MADVVSGTSDERSNIVGELLRHGAKEHVFEVCDGIGQENKSSPVQFSI